MKTKKISWQAIAIVALALVLIASIALGVSGAWFQDRDDASSQAKFADSVTVRLKDPETTKDPVSWAQYYKTNLAGALPGDYVIGKTTVYLGSATTPVVLRYNVSAKVYADDALTTEVDADYITNMTEENISDVYKNGEKNYYDAEQGKWVEAADILTKWQAEATVSLNALTEELSTGMTLSDGWEAAESGKKFGYYNKIVNAEDVTGLTGTETVKLTEIPLLANGITIPTTVNNAAENWTIVVTMEVEAIQAANLVSIDGTTINNEDWMNDMPTELQTLVKKYNAARKA